MEKIIGPTISVSVDGYYITGYSTDTLSGTAGYCYNTSDEPSEYTDADGSTTEYTAEQYHVQATGTYRFHAIDIAGNHSFDTTEEIIFYTYHCNYCGQNTNDLTNHYRCPTHYGSQSCSFYSTCNVTTGSCTNTICSTRADCSGQPYAYCLICGTYYNGTKKMYYMGNMGQSTFSCYYCGKNYTPYLKYDSSANAYFRWWCQSHGLQPRCTGYATCGNTYATNYSTN